MAAHLKFEPLGRRALTVDAIDRIKDMIRTGDLRPGDRLPPERELAAALRFSRNSLREAIRALAMMNILESRQGDGTYVTSLDPRLLAEPIHFILNIDDDSVFHLFEVRRVLESGVAYLAAGRISDDELARLERCLQALHSHADDPKKFLEDDVQFHSVVLEAARNPLLTSLMTSINELSLATRSRTVRIPGVTRRTMEDHQAVFEALRARDPEAAQRAMVRHISHIEESLRKGRGKR